MLEIISLVRSNENLKPKDLAQHFEISVKRIHDDITDLNMAGVPIIFEGNGYKILPSFFLPPMNFTLDEIFLALLSFKEAAKGNPAEDYQKNLDKLTHKFTSSLSSINQNMYKGASEKIEISGSSTPGKIPTRVFSKICQGIAEQTQVEILYLTAGKKNPI